jgi:hypothetical protein
LKVQKLVDALEKRYPLNILDCPNPLALLLDRLRNARDFLAVEWFANAPELFAKPNIDGGLIGGASLKAADFKGIIDAWKK